MNIEDLTIKQARELARLFCPDATSAAPLSPCFNRGTDHGLCILAADRGWVFVGQVIEHPTFFEMKNSRTVIYWGTTKGLEEIADGGPTSKTRLASYVLSRKIPREAVKQIMSCCARKWE